jgi:hypothetical protein
MLLKIPGNGPVHGTRINKDIPQGFCKMSGGGTFTAGGIAVNGNVDSLHVQDIKLRKIGIQPRGTGTESAFLGVSTFFP